MDARSNRTAEIASRPYNNLLRRLSQADYALIAAHLTTEATSANELLYNPGDDVQVVHFPCGPSLATFLVPNEDGRDVETILVGREGAVGGVVSEGYLPAYTRIVVKFGGPFVRIHVGKLEAAKRSSPTLRNIFARYADCMLAQIFQSTACNAIHSIEQRTAKWILAAMERIDGNDSVPLTHEQLATLLGVGRSYASRVIQSFKAQGLIETRRGSILVYNREGLKLRACLCNDAVKGHFEEVLRGVYPTEEEDIGVEAGRSPRRAT
ncbi:MULTISPECIES: Crp/Fnr family transcriptional regulator [unclassified Bradyrhizobium]|uniref:Crp/Fnr family transcriptional regulator n=1 Tax=unclassified Bradyrhizobium TaxID=2631580 RepID=UPI0004056FDB|nr:MULTISPECIES: Crp/Fnr family transcriptional regulator [unclassified Bradyrhizobium]MCP3462011.1 Crp/Fnr family transcriptional regulator [Bradyrhizobium sp. CCGUVB23]